ncbi:MAG: queuosine precursor transporter [Acidobacteria bacterium]|nr:queuosine precursor transporter [Acidobacteriota bacterium]
MSRYERVYLILCAFFIASLLTGNMLVFKAFDVPLPFVGSATLICGIIPYPITFLCTDLISELYGKRRADAVVIAGFLVSIYMLLVIQTGRAVPLSHFQDPIVQEQYDAVFGQSVRAIFASMVAYLVAQLLDVRIYHFWKRWTNGKHLWLRNNGSTLISQLVDTILVITILFSGVWTTKQIISVIIASYVFKALVALADTPLMYLVPTCSEILSRRPKDV